MHAMWGWIRLKMTKSVNLVTHFVTIVGGGFLLTQPTMAPVDPVRVKVCVAPVAVREGHGTGCDAAIVYSNRSGVIYLSIAGKIIRKGGSAECCGTAVIGIVRHGGHAKILRLFFGRCILSWG